MAELDKIKKRGRPKKMDKEPLNENKPSIKMAENEDEKVTVSEINNLWNNIFKNYSGNAGLDTLKGTISQGYVENPFIQNSRLKALSSLPREIERKDLEKAYQNPQNNENLMGNEALKPFLDKILNRSEFRILEDDKENIRKQQKVLCRTAKGGCRP